MNRRPAGPAHPRSLVLRVWGNPLARGSDRVEAVLLVGLVMVWLLGIPLFATIASAAWPSVEEKVVAVQRGVAAADAVLVTDPSLMTGDPQSPSMVQPTATATWVGRDGRPAEGSIVVRAGAVAGDHQTIWLDEQGAVVDPPMTTRTAASLLVLAAAGAWLIFGGLCFAIWRVVRWANDGRRRRLWEDAWASFDAGSRSN